jgi:hypothetical protein
MPRSNSPGHVSQAKHVTRRSKPNFASPGRLAQLVLQIREDALTLLPMYHRLHSMGLEPPRGDSVHVSGGGVSNVPPEVAIESAQAEYRRQYARWIGRELERTAKTLDRIRQGLEEHVGPGPGYRQSRSLGSDALITIDNFHESLANQGERLKAGME